MRKHLLRILTVLCLVCFGACLFAACGETEENPDDQPTTYTLTYNANGGTGADVSESHKEGDKFKLKGADAFTRDDYILTGWNDGSKTYAPADDFTMPARNVTLKAQWEENGTTPPTPDTYTVTVTGDHVTATFDAQGPYAEGTTVKFSLKVDTGYELVSVKNGSDTLTAGTDGKYSVTVAKANITITVTTKSTGGEEPTTYTLSFTGDTANVDITVDNQAESYAAGTTVTFSVTAKTGFTLVSVKNGSTELTAQNGKYSVTLNANTTITITATKDQGGEDEGFIEAADTTKPLINSGKNDTPQDDGFMMWWVQGLDWNSGSIVTMTPDKDNIASAMQNGKISFSYTGGNVDYSVQLFYKNTHLAQHKNYVLKLNITLSKCESLTIRVNGQEVVLHEGANPVEVTFEHWYAFDDSKQAWEKWSGNYGVDIQFPGTELEGVTAPNGVGIEVSDVKWYEAEEVVPQKHTVTMAENANVDFEIVEPTEAGPYAEGTVVKFTVTAHEGYTVKSVKNGDETLTETDGKYQVTVGSSDIVITVETESTDEPSPEVKTITPTATEYYGNYFVTLTVALEDGNWIEKNVEYVKVNGERTPHNGNKGWEVRGDTHTMYNVQLEAGVGDTASPKAEYVIEWYNASDEFIAKTTVRPTETPGPSTDANFTEFANANITKLGEDGVQLIVRAKATGYDNEAAMKADVTLTYGDKSIAPVTATPPDAAGGFWTIYFNIFAADLPTEAKTQVKLHIASVNKDFEAIASTAEAGTVVLGSKTWSITLEDAKLYLNVTDNGSGGEEQQKSVTEFHNAGLWADNGADITLNIWFFTTGYTKEQISAAKLTVNGVTCDQYDAGETQDTDVAGRYKTKRWFKLNDLTDLTKAKMSIEIGGDTYEVKCSTFEGDKTKTYKEAKVYTIEADEDGSLVLTVEKLPEDPTRVPKATGDGDAQNYPDKYSYYDPDGKVTEVKFEDGTLKYTWTDRGGHAWWALQIYYVDSRLDPGDRYTVSFKVTAKFDITEDMPLVLRFFEGEEFGDDITVTAKDTPVQFTKQATLNNNRQVIKLFVCGQDAEEAARYASGSIEISELVVTPAPVTKLNTPSIAFEGKNYTITDDNAAGVKEYKVNFYQGNVLYHSVTVATEAKTGELYDAVLANGTYKVKVMAVAVPQTEEAEVNYKSSDWSDGIDYTVSGHDVRNYQLQFFEEAGMPTDQWVYWTNDNNTDNNIIPSENSYNDGTVTFKFHNNTNGPEYHWHTQLFYRNPALDSNAHSVLMTITSDKAGKIVVNGKNVELIAGENRIYVAAYAPAQGGLGGHISIQFAVWGEAENSAIQEGTIVITNVQFDVPDPDAGSTTEEKYAIENAGVQTYLLTLEGDKIYYTIKFTKKVDASGLTLSELQNTLVGNDDGAMYFHCVSATLEGDLIVLKYDITDLSKSDGWMHVYKAEGNANKLFDPKREAGNRPDVAPVAYQGKKYAIEYSGWDNILVKALPDFTIDYSSIKVVEEEGKPVLKIEGTVGATVIDDTYLGFDLQDTTGSWPYVDGLQYKISVADGKFTVTAQLEGVGYLLGDGYLMHMYAGGKDHEAKGAITVDFESSEVTTASVTVGGITYTVRSHDMWGSRHMVTLTVEVHTNATGGWNVINYVYPGQINVGDVLSHSAAI